MSSDITLMEEAEQFQALIENTKLTGQNVWLDSGSYGLFENGHLFYLHYLSGRLKSKGL
jgi:hypothetical protein